MPPSWMRPRSPRTTRSSVPRSTVGRSASLPGRGSACDGARIATLVPLAERASELAPPRAPPDAVRVVGAAPRYAEIVLPVPVSSTYSYAIPAALADRVTPGARVVVPVQRRRLVGVVAAVDVAAPGVAARAILAAPDLEPAISPALLELGRWIGRYYGTPLGLALRALLPGALWRGARPTGPTEGAERAVMLAAALPPLLARARAFTRSPKRRAASQVLEALPPPPPPPPLVTPL